MSVLRFNNFGMCCRCFPLSYSPEELWENYQHYVWDQGSFPDKFGNYRFGDVLLFAPMLRYIGQRSYHYLPMAVYSSIDMNKSYHYYTCIHFDRKQGKCTNYEQRPNFCKIYTVCEYKGICESVWCSAHVDHRPLRVEMRKKYIDSEVELKDEFDPDEFDFDEIVVKPDEHKAELPPLLRESIEGAVPSFRRLVQG